MIHPWACAVHSGRRGIPEQVQRVWEQAWNPVMLIDTKILIQVEKGLKQVFVSAPGGMQAVPAF